MFDFVMKISNRHNEENTKDYAKTTMIYLGLLALILLLICGCNPKFVKNINNAFELDKNTTIEKTEKTTLPSTPTDLFYFYCNLS